MMTSKGKKRVEFAYESFCRAKLDAVDGIARKCMDRAHKAVTEACIAQGGDPDSLIVKIEDVVPLAAAMVSLVGADGLIQRWPKVEQAFEEYKQALISATPGTHSRGDVGRAMREIRERKENGKREK